jgi:branched-subunit amino acid transport protein
MSAGGLWLLVILCGLATFVWRFFGVVFARRIDPSGPMFQWVTCVSYAMVAGLVFRMIALPENDLAVLPAWMRFAAVGIAFVTYYASGSRLLPGVLAGSGALAAMASVVV